MSNNKSANNAKITGRFDIVSIVLGILLTLAAQGIYDAIFYYATGRLLEDSVVIMITALALFLTADIIFALYLQGIIFKKQSKIKPVEQKLDVSEAPFDKQLELEKIKTVRESFQMYFNLGGSIMSGGLVAFLVLLITLSYNGQLGNGYFGLALGVLLILAVGILVYSAFMNNHKRNEKFLMCSDEWFKKIEKQERLSIEEMQKQLK